MASLYEKYKQIAQTVQKINKEINQNHKEIDDITTRRTDEIPARIANLEEQLKKIDEYQLKIEGFRQLAEKNLTSRNVLTIEAPPGYRVNLNRLRTWSMMIDPQSENDPYAQRVYLVAQCDAYFLGQKKIEFESRIIELKADLENGSVDEIKSLEDHIAKLKNQLKEFVDSEEVREFADNVKSKNEGYIYTAAPEKYTLNSQDPDNWVIGSVGYELNFDPECNKRLKALLGTYYDEKLAKVYMPVETITSGSEFAMSVSCVPARKRVTEMDAGIRALLFNVIEHSKTGSRKIYIIDGERQNSALVGSLKAIEDSVVLNAVPRNAEMITSILEQIVASFSDIDDVLENYDTVIEYNDSVPEEQKLQRSIIVIIGYPNAFEGANRNYIKKILTNYERYGISFIVAQITSESKSDNSRMGISEYAGEDIVSIKMTTKDNTIKIGSDREVSFMWYLFKHNLNAQYIAFMKDFKIGTGQKGTEYIKRVDMDHIPPYMRGQKNINVPYGVDSKDEVHSISFENENFAAYLMGASGSGKSTLLHTIITGIIRNYHPDDVELWLADFKMSEFAQYIDPLPPHVKYILLDESQELVYDLIDRLTAKMMERQRFFLQHRDLKKVENVPVGIYMPVIFVILDEFSIMSQVVSENERYKLKLQNLLAKGRALGIKFIFSSQTFTRGIAGLTGTGKEQIQARIAMKNSSDEIVNTLELSAANKTEQVKAWMDALPPHYALIKYREEDHTYVKRLKVMYFSGSGMEALEPQRRMIQALNLSLRKVTINEYNNDADTYVDKQPVIVDGNSYQAYNQGIIDQAREDYLASGAAGFKDDIFVSLGDPRKMESHKFISISNESRENILLVGRNVEGACAMSVIMSVIKQFKAQAGTVHVWAYVRNRLYHEYRDCLMEGIDIHEGAEEVSIEIRRVKDLIMRGETGNELYVMMGMEQLCADFEVLTGGSYVKGNLPGAIGTKDVEVKLDDKLVDLAASSQKEIDEVARMHVERQDLDEYLESKEDELMNSSMSMEEIMEELDKLTRDFYAKGGKSKSSNEDIRKESEAVDDQGGVIEEKGGETLKNENVSLNSESDKEINNKKKWGSVADDLKEIMTKGTRYGYHFLMYLNLIADIKATRTDVNIYNHKLAFQVSENDSTLIYGSKIASKIPEHICQYSNGVERFSFRPYLHWGITWDGWDLDENGRALDPALL